VIYLWWKLETMKKYYIKERHNPQFKKPYYVPKGQLTAKDAKKMETPLYGVNIMHSYDTKEEYEKAIESFNK
jgi:hypothetical protein